MLRKVQKTNDLGFLRIHRNPSLLFLSPPNYCQKFGNTFFFFGRGDKKKKKSALVQNLLLKTPSCFLCRGLGLLSLGLGHQRSGPGTSPSCKSPTEHVAVVSRTSSQTQCALVQPFCWSLAAGVDSAFLQKKIQPVESFSQFDFFFWKGLVFQLGGPCHSPSQESGAYMAWTSRFDPCSSLVGPSRTLMGQGPCIPAHSAGAWAPGPIG